MIKGYKYRGGIGFLDIEGESIFERDLNAIVNNKIYLPTKNQLNDPTDGFYNDDNISLFLEKHKDYSSEVRKQYLGFVEKLDDIGVYSLSKNNNNELLWAYYASGHTGFAIEFDIDKLKESINHNKYFQLVYDFDVDYVKSIPKADISFLKGKDFNQILKTFMGSKSLSWKHEDEYRLIFEGKGLFDIDYRVVTGIYFGYRMKEQEINLIMDKLKGRGIAYYKMEMINNSYKFKPKAIDDKYFNAIQYVPNCLDYSIDELLLPANILGEEAYAYKDKLIEALEIVKYEPLINDIYIATIDMESGEPLFIIWANTISGFPPCKEFNFKLNDLGEVYRIK